MKKLNYVCLLVSSLTLLSCSRFFMSAPFSKSRLARPYINWYYSKYHLSKKDNELVDEYFNYFNKNFKLNCFIDTLAYDSTRYTLIGKPSNYKYFLIPKDLLKKGIKEKELFRQGCPIVLFPHFLPGCNYVVTENIDHPTVCYTGKTFNGWRELKFIVPPRVLKYFLIRGDKYLYDFCCSPDYGLVPYEFPDKRAYYRVIQPVWTEFRGSWMRLVPLK